MLSDVLGVSSLVDMLHSVPDATLPSVLGPFHVSDAAGVAMGDMKRTLRVEVLLADGRCSDMRRKPDRGRKIDIWQTAPNGLYSSQDADQDTYSFHGIDDRRRWTDMPSPP